MIGSYLVTLIGLVSSCQFSIEEFNTLESLYLATDGDHWNWNETIPSFIDTYIDAYEASYVKLYLEENSKFQEFLIDASFLRYNLSMYNGVHWNFDELSNPCTERWKGIICDEIVAIYGDTIVYSGDDNVTCHVTSLVLPYNNMTGIIPNISALTKLVEVALPFNKLTGTKLSVFEGFSELVALDLDRVEIYDKLPTSLRRLPKLETLLLSYNSLYGYLEPSFLGSSKIKNLHLIANGIRGTLDQAFLFANESRLETLGLGINQFYGSISPNVCGFKYLKAIAINLNLLTGRLPSCLTALTGLIQLDLGANQLTGPLDVQIFSNMSSMLVLNLQDNKLSSSIPAELFSLRNVYDNSSINEFLKIRVLLLADNHFIGTIPSDISNLRVLLDIDLSLNEGIVGSIPESVYSMTALRVINLYHTSVTGRLSPNISQLASLNILAIAFTQMTGPIPEELGSIGGIAYLYLNDNLFSSSIPSNLANFPIMRNLYLSYNYFTGDFPESFYSFENVIEVGVAGNLLNPHSLPPTITGWKDLAIFSITSSNAYGILDSLCQLPSLIEIQLGNNSFTSTIPECLSNLTNIEKLALYDNHLTGTIPQSLGDNLLAIKQILLYGNYLTSDISSYTIEAQSLYIFMMQQNYLHGESYALVQSLLSSASQLTYFDISRNFISGTIPAEIGEFTTLQELHLGINCFHGEIPSNLCNAANLSVFSLNGLTTACKTYFISKTFSDLIFSTYFVDYVSGTLPRCIWTMSNLQTLKIIGK